MSKQSVGTTKDESSMLSPLSQRGAGGICTRVAR